MLLTHEGQLWSIRVFHEHWPDRSGNRGLAAVPMYHKNAMAGAFKPPLHAGGSIVIRPDFKPESFLRALEDHHCTNTGGVPAVYTALLQHRDLIAGLDLSNLRGLSVGSAPVRPELLADIEVAFGVPCVESYALTEGGPVPIAVLPDTRAPAGSCGKILPEGGLKLVDAWGNDHLTEGELWVRNPGVTPSYWKRDDMNPERIGDGWLRTGDLFRRDAKGWFYFMGRFDDIFTCSGENIYPKEVENFLLGHSDITDASAVPLPHAVKGAAPVALITVVAGSMLDEVAAKAWSSTTAPPMPTPTASP